MRNIILRLLGHGYLISFIEEFEYQATQSENNSVRVYPSGEYNLTLDGLETEQMSFDTPMERAAFVRGLRFAGENIYGFDLGQAPVDDSAQGFVDQMSELDKILYRKKPYGSA